MTDISSTAYARHPNPIYRRQRCEAPVENHLDTYCPCGCWPPYFYEDQLCGVPCESLAHQLCTNAVVHDCGVCTLPAGHTKHPEAYEYEVNFGEVIDYRDHQIQCVPRAV